MIRKILFFTIGFVFLLIGFFVFNITHPKKHTLQFDDFTKADEIKITDNISKPIKIIQDRQIINNTLDFLLQNEQGWEEPFPEAPIGNLAMQFYNHGTFLGHIGIGERFLTTQIGDYFLSKQISQKDQDYVLRVLNVKLKDFE